MEGQQPAAKSNVVSALIVFVLIVNLFLILKIAAPDGHHQLSRIIKPNAAFIVQDEFIVPASADRQQSEATSGEIRPKNESVSLEWQLIGTGYDGQYSVETYREYEIYKDEHDRVIKSVPTSHFNYLRYWQPE